MTLRSPMTLESPMARREFLISIDAYTRMREKAELRDVLKALRTERREQREAPTQEKIRGMVLSGDHTASSIALALGLRYQQVLKICSELGLPQPWGVQRQKKDQQLLPLLRSLAAKGYSRHRAARETGLHHSLVTRLNTEYGLGLLGRETKKPEHGTQKQYRRGCRCDNCRRAHTLLCRPYSEAYRKRQKEGLIDNS